MEKIVIVNEEDLPKNEKPLQKKPLEPDFLDNSYCLSTDMHLDWLRILASENVKRISEASSVNFFLTKEVVEYIFTVCVRLRLPQEVKYAAALIFEHFMTTHTEQIYSLIYQSDYPDLRKFREWERVETTLSRQITLRILSSLQIASKYHNYHDSLSLKTVQLGLRSLGFAYTKESIMRSEIRVLETIEWKNIYHFTPLVYIETILKLLVLHCPLKFDVARYWQYSLFILDYVFLYQDDIYKRMLKNVLGPASEEVPRERICRVQSDWILMADGVVATTAGCVDGMAVADEIISILQEITGTPIPDITDMCIAIIECVIDSNENNKQPASGVAMKQSNI